MKPNLSFSVSCPNPDFPQEQHLDIWNVEQEWVGAVSYTDQPGQPLQINMISIAPPFHRQGFASAAMRQLEAAHPDRLIDHGYRTPAGRKWAERFYGVPFHQCAWTFTGRPVEAPVSDQPALIS